MDDDRLARAREGDLDAFLDLVRPRAARLLRLAAIAAGDPALARRAAGGAIRTAWRDARRLAGTGRLDGELERGLVAGLPRRYGGGDPRMVATPLVRTLHGLAPAERIALARCLDPAPGAAALAVAGRAGVEVGLHAPAGSFSDRSTARPGAAFADSLATEIVDLDGPLAEWDLARLRAALAASSRAPGVPGPDDLVDELRAELAGSQPDARLVVVLRAALPSPGALARGAALVLAAAVGIGVLATVPGGAGPGVGNAAGSGATAAPAADAAGGPTDAAGRPADAAGRDGQLAADVAADFPSEVEGLPVVGVEEARRLARDPAVSGRSIAIRGWLSPPALRDACLAPAPAAAGTTDGNPVPRSIVVGDPFGAPAAFCHRQATLREAADATWRQAHLHPVLLPGTGLGRARRIFAASPDRPLPVVVLGHFGDPRVAVCTMGGRHCGEELVIDRIAWVLGARTRPAVAVRPAGPGAETSRTGRDAMELAEEAFGGIRAVAAAGVPASDLATVEPAAAGIRAPSGFAWVVRAIVEPRLGNAPGAARTWLVIDDGTGEVLAARRTQPPNRT